MLSSVIRGGQSVAGRAARAATGKPLSAARAPGAPRTTTAGRARRNMGGHARNIGLPNEHVPIHVSKVHQTLGTVYMATMFLWMMYRAKEDGLVLLGLEHPWDHMHHDHGHEDGPKFQFKPEDMEEDAEEDEEDEE